MSDAELEKRADKRVDLSQLVKATTAIEHVWERVALVLKPQMFDMGSIQVIKREHNSEFTRAHAMLHKWVSNVDTNATRRQLILAMCSAGEKSKAREVFEKDLVEFVQLPKKDQLHYDTVLGQSQEVSGTVSNQEFIGREDEVKDITHKLVENEVKVVFVSGPPGIGKTVFAEELCKVYEQEMFKRSIEATHSWKDIRDEITNLEGLFSALVNVEPQPAGCPETGFDSTSRMTLGIKVIKSMPRNHILVLDACEHVLNSSLLLQFIQEVSKHNCELKLILTSQETADFRHRRTVHTESLRELTEIEAEQILRNVGGCPHVHEPSCKQNIVRQCHGLPLALVAVRTLVDFLDFNICDLSKTLTKSNTVEVLSDDLEEEPRLKTLYDTLFSRLGAKKPSLYFATLAISTFGGPFTSIDFEAITDVAECKEDTQTSRRKLLNLLHRNSVIRRCIVEEHKSVRYEMHAVMKQYVQTIMTGKNIDFYHRIASRFLLHYSKTLGNAFEDAFKSDSKVMDPIEDLPNVRVFLKMLVQRREGDIEDSMSPKQPIIDQETAKCLLHTFSKESVGHFLSLWFSHRQRLEVYECLSDLFGNSHIAVVQMQLEAARIKRGKGRYDEALSDVQEIYKTWAEGNDDLKSLCLELMGSIKARRSPGSLNEAEDDLKLCMSTLKKTVIPHARQQAIHGNKTHITRIAWRMASVLLKLLEVYINRSDDDKRDYDNAQRTFGECLVWFKEASPNEESMFKARIHQRMSTLFQADGKYDNPRILREHLETARFLLEKDELTRHHLYGQVCHSLGRSHSVSEPMKLDVAMNLFENSLQVQEQPHMDRKHENLAILYHDYGLALTQKAEEMDANHSCQEDLLKRAQIVFDKSINIFQLRDNKVCSAKGFMAAGKTSRLRAELDKSKYYYAQALKLWQSDELKEHQDATRYQHDCHLELGAD